MILVFVGIGLLLVSNLVSLFIEPHKNKGSILQFGTPVSTLFWWSLYAVFMVVLYSFVFYTFKKREKKRQLATQGDEKLLAKAQPVPNEHALALPTKIEIGADKNKILLFMGLPMLIAVPVGIVVGFTQGEHNVPSPQGTTIHLPLFVGIIIGTMMLIVILSIVFGFVVFFRKTYQRIEVSEEGITAKFLGKVTTLRWEEARFFAVAGVNKRGRQEIYELSNPEKVLHWTVLNHNIPFWATMLRPRRMTYDEYETKMNALFSYIEARTHLPLYDLREQNVKWWM
jgi:xanthosine utilization system XapX-like protein